MPDHPKVALIGAGFIARDHLDALRFTKSKVVAIVDPDLEKAARLSRQFSITRVHSSLQELAAEGGVDLAHILVPPESHAEVARQCLALGLNCLVEKPLCLDREEMTRLDELAREKGLTLGVNHNMTFVPAYRKLQRDLAAGRLGRLEHLLVVHNTPLRQLVSGDVSHFMFRTEANILWEQGVHVFSLVQPLLGRCLEMKVEPGPPVALPNGVDFIDRWTLFLKCERGTAQVFMAYGRTMPETSLHAIGSDGTGRVDLVRSHYSRREKTRWLDFMDLGLNLVKSGSGSILRGLGAIIRYCSSLFRLCPPSDPFSEGMRGSIQAFHRALVSGGPAPVGVEAAGQVSEMVEMAAEGAGAALTPPSPWEVPTPGPARLGEVVITGGTGFMGKVLVPLLQKQGHPVTLVVRRPQILAPGLRDPEVRIFIGDARDETFMTKVLEGAEKVIHMATCAATDPAGMEEAMMEGVRAVGEACLARGVKRLLFTSSTAAIYLGDQELVTGACGTDPQPELRPEYARGKIAAEKALQELVREKGLPAVVLRPAIVVGAGGLAEHSGVGLWVRDNHCVGWGKGHNPLPFLLVEDCARAIAAALTASEVVGKAYNLAGDVRISAREYMRLLARTTGRAYFYHPQTLGAIWTMEFCKWFVKFLARKPGAPMKMRDLRSRAFLATLDTTDARADLAWTPEADRDRFIAAAIAVHGPGKDQE